MRVAITGAPKTGKTTLSGLLHAETNIHVVHTDDFLDREWSAQSRQVVWQMEAHGPWIIEGCTVSRALGKWVDRNPLPPCTHLIYLTKYRNALTKGQMVYAKRIEKMMLTVVRKLEDCGVGVLINPTAGHCLDVLRRESSTASPAIPSSFQREMLD